jgi:hypothetical protein
MGTSCYHHHDFGRPPSPPLEGRGEEAHTSNPTGSTSARMYEPLSLTPRRRGEGNARRRVVVVPKCAQPKLLFGFGAGW